MRSLSWRKFCHTFQSLSLTRSLVMLIQPGVSSASQVCLQSVLLMWSSYDEPIPEEGAYSRANSCQSGDSMRSTRSSSDDGEHSTADGESSSTLKGEKRQRFADRRKDHYDMKTALQK